MGYLASELMLRLQGCSVSLAQLSQSWLAQVKLPEQEKRWQNPNVSKVAIRSKFFFQNRLEHHN
jgi:hypothetical protein